MTPPETTFTLNVNTNVVHRDPGCTRIVIGRASNFVDLRHVPGDAKRCAYCHSKAGYRRYP